MEWQPIETAPKDGRCFLVFEPQRTRLAKHTLFVARWDEAKRCWISQPAGSYGRTPTHWMPLPDPPASPAPAPAREESNTNG